MASYIFSCACQTLGVPCLRVCLFPLGFLVNVDLEAFLIYPTYQYLIGIRQYECFLLIFWMFINFVHNVLHWKEILNFDKVKRFIQVLEQGSSSFLSHHFFIFRIVLFVVLSDLQFSSSCLSWRVRSLHFVDLILSAYAWILERGAFYQLICFWTA